MPPPATRSDFVDRLTKSGLLEPAVLAAALDGLAARGVPADDPRAIAYGLVQQKRLTKFQAELLLQGKHRGFFIGRYKLLDLIGTGGMGRVYLCEHTSMGHRVAMKVLPTDPDGGGQTAVARFQREARAVAALNHPNIVRAYDLDRHGENYFLIMEYVEGLTLHDAVRRFGPLDVNRAANYVAQAANGLQHIAEAGLAHRDIKPANLLVDRGGTVKVLDLGLASFQDDRKDELTMKQDPNTILGTADYLSPEQAIRGSDADIRSDIYSLGASFYFLLAGKPPFDGMGLTQKIISHQSKAPTPITAHRPDVPAELAAVLHRMLAKNPADRHQTPAEVVHELLPWGEPAPPPLPVSPQDEGPDDTATGTPTRTTFTLVQPIPALKAKAQSGTSPHLTRPGGPAALAGSTGSINLDAGALLREAIAAAKVGKKDVARRLLTEVTASDPRNETAWLWLAGVAEDPQTGVECLQRVLKINPANDRAKVGLRATRLQLVQYHVRKQERAKAWALLSEIVADDPNHEAAWVLMAEVADDPEAARRCLTEALRVNPHNAKAQAALQNLQPAWLPAAEAPPPPPEPAATWACPLCGHKAATDHSECPHCEAILTFRPPADFAAHKVGKPGALAAAVDRLAGVPEGEADYDTYVNLALALLNQQRFADALAELENAMRGRPAARVLAGYLDALRGHIAAEANSLASRGGRRTVLVVDDSPTVRKLVALTLEKAGYVVAQAEDGYQAMSLVKERGVPGLFLLDIMMPGMDGWQLCKLIRQDAATARVPVVMLSGKDGFFNKVRGRIAGASQYITKPFKPDELVAAVKKHVAAAG